MLRKATASCDKNSDKPQPLGSVHECDDNGQQDDESPDKEKPGRNGRVKDES
jgi:hypothetical protein